MISNDTEFFYLGDMVASLFNVFVIWEHDEWLGRELEFLTVNNFLQKHFIIGCIYRPPSTSDAMGRHLNYLIPWAKLIGDNISMPSLSWNPVRDPSYFEKFFQVRETNGWSQLEKLVDST